MDFRYLNYQRQDDQAPLSLIEDMLDGMSATKSSLC